MTQQHAHGHKNNRTVFMLRPVLGKLLQISNYLQITVTLYNTGALIYINSCLTNALIITS